MKFLRGRANDSVMRCALFGGSFLDLIQMPKQLSFPAPVLQIAWATGDSVYG